MRGRSRLNLMSEMPLLSKSLLAATFFVWAWSFRKTGTHFSGSCSRSFEHDLFGKPVPLFPIMLSTRKGRRKSVATPESVSLVDALY